MRMNCKKLKGSNFMCCVCSVTSVVSNSLQPNGLQLARLLCPWDSPGENTKVGSCSLLQRNLPNPGIEPRTPALQADSLPAEPPGIHLHIHISLLFYYFNWWRSSKESTCNTENTGDIGLIPGLGRSPAGGYGNPFQYSYLENSMDNEPGKLESIAFQSQTRLRNFHTLN